MILISREVVVSVVITGQTVQAIVQSVRDAIVSGRLRPGDSLPPILLSYLFFSIALNRVYRRYRLVQHGLDPELVNAVDRVKNADLYAEYHRIYRGENGRPVSVSR